MSAEDPRAAATAWLESDPDPQTREQTRQMLEADDAGALQACFGRRLAFGTAGLRGPLGPGPACMNRAVVRGVSAAVANWIQDLEGPVVIGFDGRIGSEAFAAEAAAVFGSAGRTVYLYDAVCPTPELAHAVRVLSCAAGVMVTASHNPPGDNGYKVYAADGAQILPPDAARVAEAWTRIGTPASPEPLEELRNRGRVQPVPSAVGEQWVRGVLDLRVHQTTGVRVVYTAMHGVGRDRVVEVLSRAGHNEVHVVPEQAEPDGRFPTVAFPNPEEPGALDLALALAARVDADLVIANDPDADRLAVAVPDGTGWRTLSGNEVGWLLADDLLEHGPRDRPRLVATTLVSSLMLRRIAVAHGAEWTETLTGFKWLGHAAKDFEAAGGRFVLGYEEALGYCAGHLTRDKDGVSAALLLVDLVAWCRQQGQTLLDRIEGLHRRHGLHLAGAHSIRVDGVDGPARIARAMRALRADPPASLAGRAVARIVDRAPDFNVLSFELEGGRATVRPSGTEPKLKLYYEVILPLASDASIAQVRGAAEGDLDRIRDELLGRLLSPEVSD